MGSIYFLCRWLGLTQTRLQPLRIPISVIIALIGYLFSGVFFSVSLGGISLYVILFFLLLGIFLKFEEVQFREVFSISGCNLKKSVLSGIGIITVSLPTVMFTLCINQILLLVAGWKPSLQQSVVKILDSNHIGEIIRFAVLILVAAPFVEETLFRSLIYRRLRLHFNSLTANLLQAVMFSISHFFFSGLLPLFFLGFILARLYEKNGCIFSCIIAHMFFNFCNLLIILLTKWYNVTL